MEGRSDGRRNGSGSFSAEPSGFGGGADVKGGPGAGDGGAQGTWRGRQADCPRARSRSQDGQALVEAGQLAAAASALSAQADRIRRVHRAARAGGGLERGGAVSRAQEPGLRRELSAGAALFATAAGPAQVVGA